MTDSELNTRKQSKASGSSGEAAPIKEAEPTAGARYVAAYLPDLGNDADPAWLAEAVDDGRIRVCPRCFFLHLPRLPYPVQARGEATYGPPVDACDVCEAVPRACDPKNWAGDWADALRYAADEVADERVRRAIVLFNLFMSAYDGADALRVAALAEARNSLVRMARTPAQAGG